MNEPKVVIILLNYNQLNNITNCIESLWKINYRNFQIILIDNCSTDNSWDIIKSRYPNIPKYENEKNSGYTGGINFGIKKALCFKPKYILVLNPDTFLTESFLSMLIKAMEDSPAAAAAGGLVVAEHDRDTIWYAGGKLVPWRGLAIHYQKGQSLKNYKKSETQYVTFLTGCMVLFRADILNHTGVENEKFFLYLEDIEISARMIKKGYKLIYVPGSVIYHKILGEENDVLKLYYSVRNRLLLINLMNSGIIKLISTIYFLTVINIKLLYWLFFRRDFYYVALKGLRDYFFKNFYEGRGLSNFYKNNI